ncbi:DNA-3-methyladenine glycosylase I [Arthrobacter sp. H14-L1]|uniref:DNA-3-methyladenine glycosylase I n=1 Tax=Arthrobacter sp. H14-L1 TaxID=2996697 RepID=UPI00227176A8|nr:DNA-3-methyladenine glycosylase I [Arthrobacter sp. H14-L1]MCY0903453.1 DNA-3-methyladenine glycosylase I [Arthrobacter sp. H14-L1]
MSALIVGTDGKARCGWAGMSSDSDYERYHDQEWGRPVTGERDLFERLSLEAFQSGLSWITILRKREAFRSAFSDFEPAAVAAFDEADVQRLLSDAAIVRNGAKIRATISNAQAVENLQDGETLTSIVYSFAPMGASTAGPGADVPSSTVESAALAVALKKRGFRFVGPTTAYAMMQAIGLVNDHLVGCWVRGDA